jgi:hypothetical protein
MKSTRTTNNPTASRAEIACGSGSGYLASIYVRTLFGFSLLALAAQSAVAQPASQTGAPPTGAVVVAETPSGKPIVRGRVFSQAKPINDARVYAYEVASFKVHEVKTDRSGEFLFKSLPAGMYKLIAFKPGFLPAVELLLRRNAEAEQKIDFQVVAEERGDVLQAEDYWNVRSRVPPDVLREIQIATLEQGGIPSGLNMHGGAFLETEMRALGGVQQLGSVGAADLHTAEIGLRGGIGTVRIGVDGSYQGMEQRLPAGSMADGQAQSLAVNVENATDQRVSISGASGQMNMPGSQPVGLESYQIDWSGKTGAKGETRVSARFTEQMNYHLNGWLDPDQIPWNSQSWAIDGAYLSELTDRTSLETGLMYQQLTADQSLLPIDQERLGLFGKARTQIGPRVLVEYGLYSSAIDDGSLALMPTGGVVVELGNWEAQASFSKRIEDREGFAQTFSSAFYGDRNTCYKVAAACYQVSLTQGNEQESISIGAIQREYAETLRLYFSPDFFERLESVFVVEGDRVPEVQFSMTRKISPRILARLESNLAKGGGGIFYATDDQPYENHVRYLVTSLDTQFQKTQTGVFIAFHHLEQAFSQAGKAEEEVVQRLELERLQLMLTQDLSALVDIAANWAVRLNMELSRGSTPYTLTVDHELYKKLTGGISVSF